MENQAILNWVFGALMTITGWVLKTIWDAVDRLKRDLNNLEVVLPTQYVTKYDIERRFDKIDAVLERIFDKLDDKVDK